MNFRCDKRRYMALNVYGAFCSLALFVSYIAAVLQEERPIVFSRSFEHQRVFFAAVTHLYITSRWFIHTSCSIIHHQSLV